MHSSVELVRMLATLDDRRDTHLEAVAAELKVPTVVARQLLVEALTLGMVDRTRSGYLLSETGAALADEYLAALSEARQAARPSFRRYSGYVPKTWYA